MTSHENKVWMVSLDGSEASFEALDNALSIINKEKDSLILLYVSHTRPSTFSRLTLTNEQLEEWKNQIVQHGNEILKKGEQIVRQNKVILEFRNYL
jgi:hypothetical protein